MGVFQKLLGVLQELQEAVLPLAPGGAGRRPAGASPITPLFFFCAFALLAAVSLGVFSDNDWLRVGAFVLFAATLVFSVCVYSFCLARRPDLLRSEGYELELLRHKKGEESYRVGADLQSAQDARPRSGGGAAEERS